MDMPVSSTSVPVVPYSERHVACSKVAVNMAETQSTPGLIKYSCARFPQYFVRWAPRTSTGNC